MKQCEKGTVKMNAWLKSRQCKPIWSVWVAWLQIRQTIWIQMKLFSKSYICALRSSWIIINNCHHFLEFTAHTIWQEWTRCRYLEYKSDNQFISFSSVQFIVTNTTWSSQFYYRFDPFTSLLHLVSYFEYPQIFFDKYDTKVANSTFLFTSDWPTL